MSAADWLNPASAGSTPGGKDSTASDSFFRIERPATQQYRPTQDAPRSGRQQPAAPASSVTAMSPMSAIENTTISAVSPARSVGVSTLLGTRVGRGQGKTTMRPAAGTPGEIGTAGSSDCRCLDALRTEFHHGRHSDVVEFGMYYLTQAAHLPLSYLVEALQYIGSSLVALREIERARGTFAMQKKVIEVGTWAAHDPVYATAPVFGGDSRTKKRWRIRYLRNMSALEEADGHREEAMGFLVEQWRAEAELFGPSSLRCLRTYLSIADLKHALHDNHTALTMLRFAAGHLESLGGKDRDRHTWMRIHRSVAEILLQTGDPLQAAQAAVHLQEVILTIQMALMAAEGEEQPTTGTTGSTGNKPPTGPSAAGAVARGGTGVGGEGNEEVDEIIDDPPTAVEAHPTAAPSAAAADLAGDREPSPAAAGPCNEGPDKDTALLIEYATTLVQYADALLLSQGNGTAPAALSSLEEADGVFKSVFAEGSSFEVLSMRTSVKLAKIQYSLGQTSLEHFLDVLFALLNQLEQAEVRGMKHSHLLLELYETMADTYAAAKFTAEACEAYEKALTVARQLFAPDHEVCAILQHKLAEVCLSAGRYDDAIHMLKELHQWALDCPKDRMTPVPLFAIQHSMGNVMRAMERHQEALKHYREALNLPEGQRGPTRARILGSMASVYLTVGDTREAVALHQEGLRIRQQSFGYVHNEVAASFHQLCPLYASLGQYKDAIYAADQCIEIITKLQGSASGRGGSATRSSSTGSGIQPDSRSQSRLSAANQSKQRSGSATRQSVASVNSSAVASTIVSLPSTPAAVATAIHHHPYVTAVSRIKASCIRELKAKHRQK